MNIYLITYSVILASKPQYKSSEADTKCGGWFTIMYNLNFSPKPYLLSENAFKNVHNSKIIK